MYILSSLKLCIITNVIDIAMLPEADDSWNSNCKPLEPRASELCKPRPDLDLHCMPGLQNRHKCEYTTFTKRNSISVASHVQ